MYTLRKNILIITEKLQKKNSRVNNSKILSWRTLSSLITKFVSLVLTPAQSALTRKMAIMAHRNLKQIHKSFSRLSQLRLQSAKENQKWTYSRMYQLNSIDFIIYVLVRRVCVCDYYSEDNSIYHTSYITTIWITKLYTWAPKRERDVSCTEAFCILQNFVTFTQCGGSLAQRSSYIRNLCTYAESYTDTWRLHAPVHPCIRT